MTFIDKFHWNIFKTDFHSSCNILELRELSNQTNSGEPKHGLHFRLCKIIFKYNYRKALASFYRNKMSKSNDVSSANLCFICNATNASLNEDNLVLVKEREIRIFIQSSISIKNVTNQRLLQNVLQISVHSACQKRYNNPRFIAAVVNRGENRTRSKRFMRSKISIFYRIVFFMVKK